MSDPLPAVPRELKQRRQWVLWRQEERAGKRTKVPYSASGHRASSTHPATWTTYRRAVSAASNGAGYSGVGYVLTADDPYVGIDLDNCIGADGTVEPWAAELLDGLAGTYCEISPSGRGVKAWVRGSLPADAPHRVTLDGGGGMEVYASGRYFAVTGRPYSDAPAVIADGQPAIDAVVAHMRAAATDGKPTARDVAGEGQRHPTLVSAAARMRARGLGGDEIEDALQDANQQRCSPPKPAAEVAAIAGWAGGKDRAYSHTDVGNAERMVARHGADIRWCDPWSCWLIWDGRRWGRDEERRIVTLAVDTVRAMYGSAEVTGDPDARKGLVDHARRSEARQKIDAMIALARPLVAVTPDELDTDPWLLSVRNGTIDLRTGQLREHRREDLITRLAPVEYRRDAACPRWKRFLGEVFQPHPDIIPFLQRAAGYSLTGDVREECFFLLHGAGRNGKGTLLRTLQAALGDYAGTADFSTFIAPRDAAMRDDVANMRGRRFIAAQEAREGAALAESLLKWLTGGDRVRARRLYENSSEFDPTFKLWLAANHKPSVRGTDCAIWSRIKLIPFDVSFDGREDRGLKQELLAELPGILAWTVRGCQRWQREGLRFPDSVTAATAEYRSESDQVGRFLEEETTRNSSARAKASLLYSAYHGWCERCGEQAMTATAFGLRMRERGWQRRVTGRGAMYAGLALRSGGE